MTEAEQEIIDAQGWNADSVAAVLASWDPATGTRLKHMQRIADEENATDEPLEGCPDCGKDTVVEGDDGPVHCSDPRCGWRE